MLAQKLQVVLIMVFATFSSMIQFSDAARANRGADAVLQEQSRAMLIKETTDAPSDAPPAPPATKVEKLGGVWKWVFNPAQYFYDWAKNGWFYFVGADAPPALTPEKPCYSVGSYLLTDDVCDDIQGENQSSPTEEFNKLVRHVHRRDSARAAMPDCSADDLKQMCSFRAQAAKQQVVAGGATQCAQFLNTWLDLLQKTSLLDASKFCKDYKTFIVQGQRAARLMYRDPLRTFEAYMENTDKFQGRMEDQAFWPGLGHNMQTCLNDDESEDAMLDKAYVHVCNQQPPPKTWTDRIVNVWEGCKGWFAGACESNDTTTRVKDKDSTEAQGSSTTTAAPTAAK